MRVAICIIAVAALATASLGCGGARTKADLKRDITAQLQARLPDMTTCYKAALERDKTIQGQMVLTFSIPKDDVKVGQVNLDTQIGDDALKQCVHGKAQGMQLNQPFHRPVQVTYPLNFTPL
jgi:hypothetical protein